MTIKLTSNPKHNRQKTPNKEKQKFSKRIVKECRLQGQMQRSVTAADAAPQNSSY